MLLAAGALALVAFTILNFNGDGVDASDDATVRPVRVLVQELTPSEYTDEIEALGTTRSIDSVDITARVTNVITEIHFTEGALVEHGEILAELENSEARADVAAAEATLVESRSQYRRSQELLRQQAVSESRVEELEALVRANESALAAAEARLQDHNIRAPFPGRVGLRRVSVGTLVSPGTVITTLDDMRTILLDFDVPEPYIGALETGQTVNARTSAFPDRAFEGVVDTIDTRVDPQTRAVTVRARLPNPDGLLRPGMFMIVRVLRETAELLMLPEQAIVPQEDRHYVYVVEDDTAYMRQVIIGRRTRGRVEITGGLETGDVVVIEGSQHLRDGIPVQPDPWTSPD